MEENVQCSIWRVEEGHWRRTHMAPTLRPEEPRVRVAMEVIDAML